MIYDVYLPLGISEDWERTCRLLEEQVATCSFYNSEDDVSPLLVLRELRMRPILSDISKAAVSNCVSILGQLLKYTDLSPTETCPEYIHPPLVLASYLGNCEIVELLLSDSRVRSQEQAIEIALLAACCVSGPNAEGRYVKTITLLLTELKVKVSYKTILAALDNGDNEDVVHLLLSAAVMERDDLMSCLFKANELGRTRTVCLLLKELHSWS